MVLKFGGIFQSFVALAGLLVATMCPFCIFNACALGVGIGFHFPVCIVCLLTGSMLFALSLNIKKHLKKTFKGQLIAIYCLLLIPVYLIYWMGGIV